MIVLGIDPGYETIGFGIINFNKSGDFSLIDFGVISTKSKDNFDKRLSQIKNDIIEILEEYNPDILSIEKLFFGTNVTNAINVAHARGIIVAEAFERGLEIFEYAPNELKSIIAGDGHASKKQVGEMVKYHLDFDKIPKPDDAVDALALALTYGFCE